MPVATSSRASAVARLAQLSLPGRVHLGVAPEPVRPLCDGGVPRGRISEFLGPASSGKTSLLLACLAAATRRGELAACVDLADALHPASVEGAGADLRRLLWVRPPALTAALRCTEVLLHAGGFAVVALDLGVPVLRPLRSHLWPRLLQAAEQSHTALIILAPQRVAGSFAVLSLGLQPCRPLWCRGLWPLFDGFETIVAVRRNKLGMPGRQVALQVVDSRELRVEEAKPRTISRLSPRAPRRAPEAR